jgi:anaerobic selenocysteine-containing dehydrogenase
VTVANAQGSPEDAASLRVADGAVVDVSVAGTTSRLLVKVRPALPSGVAGMVVGLSRSIGSLLPLWGKVIAAEAAAPEAAGRHE